MTIKLLDEHLINKIAAGEVIERPASVVKELVENAIDAGSSRINVCIAGGGIDRIEVEDNGQGIPMQDVELALQRHATSKITNEEDLFIIHTMGFRGEALPSIASISRMDLFTRQADKTGCHIHIEGGFISSRLPFQGPEGTRILVKELFYNTPVRKKFIKSPVAEQNQIYDIMCKLALSRPDISFSFSSEKKLYFKTPGNGNLRDALIAINGREYADQFIDLHITGEKYAAHGLVSKSEFHRVNRKNQIFYVNRRVIKSPMLSRAVDEGYKGLLLAREYPSVIIFLEIDSADVDINVHPQKTEVRFHDESSIFRLLNHGIHDTVNGVVFTFGDPLSGNSQKQAYFQQPKKSRLIEYQSTHLPFSDAEQIREHYVPSTQPVHFDYSPSQVERTIVLDHDNKDSFRIIGQCFNSYILVEWEGKLWLVDQHAAHERIMYTRLKNRELLQTEDSQILAMPIVLEFSSVQMDHIENHLKLFAQMGMILEILGPDSIVIRSSPASLVGQESEFIREMLEMLEQNQQSTYKEKALYLMACKQAVKAGQALNKDEMEQIMRELLSVENYMHCPHGRPTFIEITHADLDRRFKR